MHEVWLGNIMTPENPTPVTPVSKFKERYAVDVKRLRSVKVLGEGAFGKARKCGVH